MATKGSNRMLSRGATKTRPHVVVVGAGIAGLAAARTLRKHNIEVTILEARPRVGGRVYASPLGELGCSWLHGIDGNPLAEFVATALPDVKLKKSETDSISLYDIKGKEIPREQIMEAYMKFQVFMETVKAHAIEKHRTCEEKDEPDVESEGGNPRDAPLRHAIEQAYAANVEVHCKSDTEVVLFNFFFSQLESYNAARLDQLSAVYHDASAEFEGGDHILEGGFSLIINALARDMDIKLSTSVSKVEVVPSSVESTAASEQAHASKASRALARGGNMVRVHTRAGVSYLAHAVIVTVPLGVLQTKAIEFSPALPSWKANAITRLGSGVHNRAILRFPKLFWPEHTEWFGSNFPMSADGKSLVDGKTSGNTGVIRSRHNCWFQNYYGHTGIPTLVCLMSGEYADRIRNMPDKQVVDELMVRLRTIFPGAPSPDDAVLMRWEESPVAMGAYTYLRSSSTPRDIQRIARPIQQIVRFGGESSATARCSFADGAYESGVREATLVHQLFNPSAAAAAAATGSGGITAENASGTSSHSHDLRSKL